jgi:hypothetical protein
MRKLLLLVPLMLTGCQRDPGAPTAADNLQLDEAANLLNEAPANLEAIDDSGLGATNDLDERASGESR